MENQRSVVCLTTLDALTIKHSYLFCRAIMIHIFSHCCTVTVRALLKGSRRAGLHQDIYSYFPVSHRPVREWVGPRSGLSLPRFHCLFNGVVSKTTRPVSSLLPLSSHQGDSSVSPRPRMKSLKSLDLTGGLQQATRECQSCCLSAFKSE